jgi:hypothetical protein
MGKYFVLGVCWIGEVHLRLDFLPFSVLSVTIKWSSGIIGMDGILNNLERFLGIDDVLEWETLIKLDCWMAIF